LDVEIKMNEMAVVYGTYMGDEKCIEGLMGKHDGK
jgi:hypothetical protein